MPFRGQIKRLLPTKGIDNSQGEENIGDDYVYGAQNVRFADNDIRQRSGYAKHITSAISASPVTAIRQCKFRDATSRLVAASGTSLVVDSGASWTSIKGALTLTSGATNYFTWASLNNTVIGTNGIDQLFQVPNTGNATALTGTPPTKAVALLSFRQRLLAGNVTNDAGKGKIQWTILNNPNDWVGAGSGSATPKLESEEEIRGMAAVGNEAFLFYDKSIYRIVPQGDPKNAFAFPEHDSGVGCISPQSIVTVPDNGLIYFVGIRGIYEMAGPGYLAKRISKPIDGTWDSLNKTRLRYTQAVVNPFKNEVWFSVSLGAESTHSLILVWDYDRRTWTTFLGIAANALGQFENTSGQVTILHGNYTGTVFVNESGSSDDGTAISAHITSKIYPIVDGYRRGSVRFINTQLGIQGSNSNIQVEYGYDFEGLSNQGQISQASAGSTYDITGVYDTSTFAGEGQLVGALNTNGQGRFFQFKLSQSVKDDTFRCYGIQLGVITEGA